MATKEVILRPGAIGNTTGWTGTTSNIADASDATYMETTPVDTAVSQRRIVEPTPSDFLSMDSYTLFIRASTAVDGDDTWGVRVYMSDSNGNARYAIPATNSLTTPTSTIREFSFTGGTFASNDKTTWDNSYFLIEVTYGQNMGADGNRVRVYDVWLQGTYTLSTLPPNTPVIITPDGITRISGVTPLEATVTDPDGDNVRAVWELWTPGTLGTVAYSFPTAGSGTTGLTHDGTYLWSAVNANDTIYRLDPVNGTVLQSFATPASLPTGLTHDGTNLWHCDTFTDLIYKLNPADGTVLQSFAAPTGGSPQDLAWDGTNLWIIDSGADLIYRLDPADGTVLQSFATPGLGGAGLTWDGVSLWCADATDDIIYRLAPADGAILDSFASPELSPRGLAHDGTHLWNVDNNNTIYRIEAPDLILDIPENATTITSGSSHITSWDATGIAGGDYELRAWAIDSNGAQSSTYDTQAITINAAPDTPVITNPADLASFGGTISLEATVSDPDGDDVRATWELWGPGEAGAVLSSFAAPASNVNGLTWVGEYLGAVSQLSDLIYRLDPSDGSVLSSIPAPGANSSGLAWDSANLCFWVADTSFGNIAIYKVDPEGVILDSFPPPNSAPGDLAWDGTNLWNVDGMVIYALDPADGTVVRSIPSPSGAAHGLAWDGTNFWVSEWASDIIYKIDPVDGTVLDSFPSPDLNPRGLAWDGVNLWNSDIGGSNIFKLDVVGSSLVQDISEDVTTVTSGSTHATSWDSTSVAPGDYALRTWTVDSFGAQSSTYDEHTITVEEFSGVVAVVEQTLPSITQSLTGTYQVLPDPSSLTLSIVGSDILLEWPAPGMPGATHTAIFRRTGTSTAAFDPEVDTELARVPIGTLSYTDVGVADGDYAYQVIPVEEGT